MGRFGGMRRLKRRIKMRMAEYAMEQQEQQNLSGAFDEEAYDYWLNDPVAQAEYKQYLDNKGE